MRKIMSIVFAGIFIMPLLCESYGLIEAEVYKNYGASDNDSKNEHRSDSVSVDYDDLTNTIVISNGCETETEVGVQIYKDGVLIYADSDNVEGGHSLNYNIADEEAGDYDVRVDIKGHDSIETTVTNE